MPNPYADFVKSLSDTQLDTLWESMNVASELAISDGDLWEATADEYESRERRTSLTFYTPHVDEFKRLLAEEQHGTKFAHTVIQHLAELRMASGWSQELEAAFKILIIELMEQIT